MLFVFTDTDNEYQSFPEPAPGERPYFPVAGAAEQRIRNGDHWRLNASKTAVEFLSQSQIDAARLPDIKAALLKAVDDERESRIAQGMLYTFPDGQGTVQLRSERDMRNVQGVASAGQALTMLGDTTTKLTFRDTENVTHEMTGSQAVTMGMAVSGFITAFYQAAWSHKDAIKDLTTIPSIETYDITTGWPS